jgi:hypothetical protein
LAALVADRQTSLQPRLRRALHIAIETLLVTTLYAVTAAVLLRPLFDDPFGHVYTSDLIGGRADRDLILWVLAWDWHALTTDLGTLFDANMLHPARNSLAGNEHMLGVVPLSGPAQALTGNPLFAYSTALLLSIALSGSAMYWLLRYWDVSRAGALFGGFVYAMFPARSQTGYLLQFVSGQYLPLAIIALGRTLSTMRPCSALAFGTLLLWQMLCSVYWAFMLFVALIAYSIAHLGTAWRELHVKGIALAVLGAGLAGAIALWIHSPHAELLENGRIQSQNGIWIASLLSNDWWKTYLISPIALRNLGYTVDQDISFYVGIVPLLTAMSILFLRRNEESNRSATAIALALALAGYVFALGPSQEFLGREVPLPYAHLTSLVPQFSAMRVPSRFGFLMIAGFAALAGIGMGRIHARIASTRVGPVVAALFVACAALATSAEWDLLRGGPKVERLPVRENLPEVYEALAKQPPGALLELPFGGPGPSFHALHATRYMYYSTYHWRPLLNGYTGHAPATFPMVSALASALPSERALEILGRCTDVRYVIVHRGELPESVLARWSSPPPGLRLLHRTAGDLLFEVEVPPEADLVERFLDIPVSSGATVMGTPTGTLSGDAMSGSLRLVTKVAERAPAASFVTVEVEVTNQSTATWPAMARDPKSIVSVDHRWQRRGTRRQIRFDENRIPPGRLPLDLAPGESIRFHFVVQVPKREGEYTLVLGLSQGINPFSRQKVRSDVSIEPRNEGQPPSTKAY